MANRITNNEEEVYEAQRSQLGTKIENDFLEFLANFELNPNDENYKEYGDGLMDVNEGEPIRYYVHQAQKLREQERVTMWVDFAHLTSFEHSDPEFVQNIVRQYYKYEPYLRTGLTKFMQKVAAGEPVKKSYHQIAIHNLPQMSKIRELRTLNLGRLMSIYGTVTRTTDAKPELIMGTFRCLDCNNLVKNVEQQFKYTEPVRCSYDLCMNKTRWELINKDSTMVDW